MTFKQNIAAFVHGSTDLTQLPAIALQALEEGIDSPSLRILAGLTSDEYASVIQGYFNDTIRELDIVLPTQREAAIEVALAIAEEIFNNTRELSKGVQDIIYTIQQYPFFEESKKHVYDSISLEQVTATFYTIQDLNDAIYDTWVAGKTNKELLAEQLQILYNQLKKWYAHMKSVK